MEVASFHRHKVSITSFFIYHTYRALRANAKWGCGCEFPLCPLLALDLAWVPLNPISCAAAWQRWVTRPVNDKSRLGRKLEHTEVHKTCCHPFYRCCLCLHVMPEVVCTWAFCIFLNITLPDILCTVCVSLIPVSLGNSAISDLWPYMVSQCSRYKGSFSV